ncbi:putative 3-keto steroid reductase-like protein [Diaporthe ampelina]|uniref:Putative 3-keto steroid reductase-like protein n=1 Tax=Diaporthe ampelina TaxID=1214573 RepID=A0A0G2FJQ5_9PEZI|nr:putative 3-keto steroid reductase-like protein [Diaporthe ampelina]
MAAAPWADVPAKDTFFALVTGANSGIGLGICQRLIDEFLATRSLTSHLVLIPTARDTRKSAATAALLRSHLGKTAASEKLRARGAAPSDTAARVHLLSLQLDLCDFATVHAAASRLVGGTLALDGHDGGVRVPRLDAVIFNAGIGGWTGVNWLRLAHNLVTAGWVQATTWPQFKIASEGATVNPLPSQQKQKQANGGGGDNDNDNAAVVGQVFCANVFGHYLFAHAILPLLTRRRRGGEAGDADIPPGRLIWEGSIDGGRDNFCMGDLQALGTHAPYESTKRLTDLLVLTAGLPGSRTHSAPWWRLPASPGDDGREEEQQQQQQPPKVYVCHPGIVVTTILPLPFWLQCLWTFAAYVARWIGSPWHTNTSYNAAAAMVWLALTAQEALDSAGAESIKWGSACDIRGNTTVKVTEVDGWGWRGKVEGLDDEDGAAGLLRKTKGRRSGAQLVTEEMRVEFEETGALCWREMERLRAEWEARMKEVGLNGHA